MTMDNFGNLWYAQHVIDKVTALDPRTGESVEVDIPISGSFIQYLTSDNNGNIWFAAQRASSIGSIITSPGSPSLPSSDAVSSGTAAATTTITVETREQAQLEGGRGGTGFATALISYLGLSSADIIGPLLAGGVILSALLYSKTVIDLSRNMGIVTKVNRAGSS